MKSVATVRFNRELLALLKSHRIKESRIRKILHLIQTNPRSQTLKLHKLSGTNNYALSVDRDIRMIVHFEDDIVLLLRIGSHDDIY